MNRRIASLACALAGASVIATVPAQADVYGVAEKGDVSSTPAANMSVSDPAGIGGIYAPGYTLTGVTTSPSSFGGMNWPKVGKTLTSGQSGLSSPLFCSASFEVPTGDLSQTAPLNPNLTIVVQNSAGDYYYAGKNQGLAPSYVKSQGGYDLFSLVASSSQFVFAPGPPTTPFSIVKRIALVWSGWNDTTPPINSMYVTRPLINSQNGVGNYVNHVPTTYNATEETTFNFQ